MSALKQSKTKHPAHDDLVLEYTADLQPRLEPDVSRGALSNVLNSLHLEYSDSSTGKKALVKTREDFEKTEIFDRLKLLYRGDTNLSSPSVMDEIYDGLSRIDRQIEENPDNLAVFPEELQELLLRVAERVRDLRNPSVERLVPPEANEIEERWNTRDKGLKESPLEFVQRVYASWVGRGLERGHLRRVDSQLYKAIDNWSRKPGNHIPETILPNSYVKHGEAQPDDVDRKSYNKINALSMRSHRKRKSG